MKKFIMIFIFILLTSAGIYAHPHLFVTPNIKLIISGNVLEKIEFTWKWDEWWSRDVFDYCDLNYDGIFNDEETDLVYQDFFKGLEDYDYFMIIKADGKKTAIKKIEDFTVFSSGQVVFYTFSVPVNLTIGNETDFKIVFNDETIYTSFDHDVTVISEPEGHIHNLKIGQYSYYGVQAEFSASPDQ